MAVPGWPVHLSGQPVAVRLSAEDGFQAQRSYSIASAPEDRRITITVERLDDGEVSPYLVGELRAKDKIELRGPIGGVFVWRAPGDRPPLLIARRSPARPPVAMIPPPPAPPGPTPGRPPHSART